MKNTRFERLTRMQRQYHRAHPWRLSAAGLFAPHLYDEANRDQLSWWDDVGFVLNRRRAMVWWAHPRNAYLNAIEAQSLAEAGECPPYDWLFDDVSKTYRRVGRSRKRTVGYRSARLPSPVRDYYAKMKSINDRLVREGIDHEVCASWRWERLPWADGISLVAPLEVRNEAELEQVADLARDLILGRTTLSAEFPGYMYGRRDWLLEQQACRQHR